MKNSIRVCLVNMTSVLMNLLLNNQRNIPKQCAILNIQVPKRGTLLIRSKRERTRDFIKWKYRDD